MSTNITISTKDLSRIAAGQIAYVWSGVISGDRAEMEAFMRRKAREIREANRDVHIRFYIDWNPEEVPFDYGDYTEWVLCPVGDITASRR